MKDFGLLNDYYKKFSTHFHSMIPDGIYTLNLEWLHQLGALHFHPGESTQDRDFTKQFTLIESPDKLTLINHQFIIWILSEKVFDLSFSTVFIAFNEDSVDGSLNPKLEAAIIASGVYNSPKILLTALEKFLSNMMENEWLVEKIKKAS